MDLRLLGPVEASVDDHPVAIGAGKPRALLAMLALNAGAAVSAEQLIDGLWGEAPPATAPKMVQIYVSQLRKAFKGTGNGAEIVTRGHGYELRLGEGEVDAHRFERLVAEGAPREALALWRGPPLDDVATEPFAGLEIRRLEELRLAATELALEQDLAAGRHTEVIGEIQALLAHEPLRERLHGLRMLALYRSGRQADALGAYRRARDELVNAIGVEPGPDLRRLHEAILRQDPALDLPLPAELPPELEATTPLVGRDRELDELREHWRRARAGDGAELLITGVTGIGKTRLAAELAAEVQRDGGHVLYASGAGSPGAARQVIERARAARRPTLLVMDDAGHARGEVTAELERLAVRDRALLVLATAQDGPGATMTLAPLARPDIEAIAREYGEDPPLERLAEESDGIPQRVHRAARRWARAEAARRLGATADRAAGERARLHAAEDDLAAGVVELQAARERAAPPWNTVACPFKGLASFDVDDADVFFGRERLVAEMVARIAGAPLLGIVGPSGSGKSSALRAGLLPALAQGVLPGSGGWAVALLRPGAHPVEALERAIAATAPAGRLVVAVDQFEEVFTACRDEAERTAFADALVAAVRDPRRRALVLIALRADFYGRCASYPELWRMLGASHVPVGPMRRDELRRAIESPAQRAGLVVDAALVDALIADVKGEPGALPLLSTALLELWQAREGDRLTLAAYDHAGGVRGAVARLAERAYDGLEPEQQAGARAILVRLAGIGEGGTARNRATAADAQRLGSRALAENDLDRSLLLARQGVALDDSAQTRGNLLAALIKSPAALGVMRGGGERMSAVALSPDERTLAAGDPAGNLFLFDTRTRRRVKAPEVHPGEWSISQLAYSPDGRRLGIAHDSADGHVLTLMDTRTRRMGPRLFLDEYGRRITGVRFAGATEVDVASAQLDPTTDPRSIVERFDLRTGRRSLGPRTLERQPSPLLATRDNRRVLTVTDERLVVRDGRTLGPVQSIDIGPSRGGRDARAIALGPDDRTAALGEQDGSVRFVDLRTGAVRRASGRHGGAVTGARFTPDGRSLVTTSDDGDAILWDVGAGAASETFRGHANGIAALQITRDGRTLYTAGLDGAIFAWDLAGTRRLGRPIEVGPPNRALAALSADGKRLALGHDNGAISVVDLEAPDRRRTFAVVPDGEEVIGVRFVPGSRLLVVAGPTLFTALVDTDTGRIIRALDRPGAEGLFTPGVSGDGRLLATPGATHGGDLIEVDLWSLPDGHRVGEPLRVDRQIHDLQLSPDGRLFIVVLANAGLEGGSVEAWDVRTRRRVRALRFARIQSFARFSPDGRRFAVGNRSGETRVYETATFKPVTRVLSGDAGAIISAAITPDRRTLATGSETGAVQLWDIPSGQALGAPLPGVPSSGVIPDFTPDGSTLVAAYASGRAYLWDIRPASLAQHACAVAGRRLTRAEWAEFLPGRDYEPAC